MKNWTRCKKCVCGYILDWTGETGIFHDLKNGHDLKYCNDIFTKLSLREKKIAYRKNYGLTHDC